MNPVTYKIRIDLVTAVDKKRHRRTVTAFCPACTGTTFKCIRRHGRTSDVSCCACGRNVSTGLIVLEAICTS